MTWADYYLRYDDWQESTQYSRLASVSDFGPDSSPSEQIADCIQYVNTRTATSIVRKALTGGVQFRASEIAEIVDSGQVEDEEILVGLIHSAKDQYTGEQLETLLDCFADTDPVMDLIQEITSKPTHFTEEDVLVLAPILQDTDTINRLVASTDAVFSEDGLNELCDYGLDEKLVMQISQRSNIPYDDPNEPDEDDEEYERLPAKKPGFLAALLMTATRRGKYKPSAGKCNGDCAHCPPHYGYRYGRWYYGHGHQYGCEFCGNGGCNGKCNRD